MPLKIILAGGSGFLGTLLADFLTHHNYQILLLSRRPAPSRFPTALWDGRTLGPWARHLHGAHALINLAGRSVNCRYTPRNRRLMMDSRILSTRVLAQALAECPNPPAIWLNSSTATIYRHTLGPAWDESGEIGSTPAAKDAFSIQIATSWEHEFFSSSLPNIRKVALRTAIVLSTHPGTMFPIVRRLAQFGLAGPMASGNQFVSWIHQTDFCRAIEFLLQNPLSGPVNVAAPNPETNARMMHLFHQTTRNPIALPTPLPLLELGAFFHRTETELLIKSRHVIPAKLTAAGFQFHFPTLAQAITNLTSTLPPRKMTSLFAGLE